MQSSAMSVADETIFVMNWRQQYHRYCLEPQDSTSIQERLAAALKHIDESMTEDNLRKTRRPKAADEDDDAEPFPQSGERDERMIQYRNYYRGHIEGLLRSLEEPATALKSRRRS